MITPAPDARDQRLLHRLEAFSDIVIGFSLAQVGLNLTLPANLSVFFAKPTGLLAFALSFILVSVVWWIHNRLFAHYFVPNMLSIVLNFIVLGSIVLFVFSVQVLVHFKFQPAAYEFYCAMLAIIFILLSALYFIGLAKRRGELNAGELREGRRKGTRLGIIAIAIFLAIAAGNILPGHPIETPAFLPLIIAAAVILVRAVDRFVPAMRG